MALTEGSVVVAVGETGTSIGTFTLDIPETATPAEGPSRNGARDTDCEFKFGSAMIWPAWGIVRVPAACSLVEVCRDVGRLPAAASEASEEESLESRSGTEFTEEVLPMLLTIEDRGGNVAGTSCNVARPDRDGYVDKPTGGREEMDGGSVAHVGPITDAKVGRDVEIVDVV